MGACQDGRHWGVGSWHLRVRQVRRSSSLVASQASRPAPADSAGRAIAFCVPARRLAIGLRWDLDDGAYA